MQLVNNKRKAYVTGLALVALLVASLLPALNFIPTASADSFSFASPDFSKVWNRTDKFVADGRASRTYLWGPAPFTGAVWEPYDEAPGGKRLVQYFDKSRMEITNPNGDKNSSYYVTNGLIVKEMITGRIQTGDHTFQLTRPSQQGVAGDPDDVTGPTYNALDGQLAPTEDQTNILVGESINWEGTVSDDIGNYGPLYQVSYAHFEPATGHNIAGPFWSFLNQSGPVANAQGNPTNGRLFDPVFYATGYPITEAYWARVKVGGTIKDVLIQAFERRIMTFTPSNDPAFQVEMGNVGRHYYDWRYGDDGGNNPQPQDTCSNLPKPTNANIRPGQCFQSGQILSLDIGNFLPNEQVGFWLTDPNGLVVQGTKKTYTIGSTGAQYNLQYDTSNLYPGVWYFVFEGTTSRQQAVIYFLITD